VPVLAAPGNGERRPRAVGGQCRLCGIKPANRAIVRSHQGAPAQNVGKHLVSVPGSVNISFSGVLRPYLLGGDSRQYICQMYEISEMLKSAPVCLRCCLSAIGLRTTKTKPVVSYAMGGGLLSSRPYIANTVRDTLGPLSCFSTRRPHGICRAMQSERFEQLLFVGRKVLARTTESSAFIALEATAAKIAIRTRREFIRSSTKLRDKIVVMERNRKIR